MIRLAFFVLFLSGCGQFYPIEYIHPELRPFVYEFEKTYNTKIDYTVTFGKTENDVVGYCKIIPHSQETVKEIIISREFFDNNDYYTNHQLIFHEFGHCSFYLEHDGTLENHRATSIMHPYVFGFYDYYEQNLEYYLTELWNKFQNSNIKTKVWNTYHAKCTSTKQL